MSGGPVFYSQRRVFSKLWQRHLVAIGLLSTGAAIGMFYTSLSYQRHSRLRGRTSLYGKEPYQGGQYVSADR